MKHRTFACAAAALAAIASADAPAGTVTIDLVWSGAEYGNTASATGQVTIDDSFNYISNGGGYLGPFAGSAFSDFEITVTGSVLGNGTFSSAAGDFLQVFWISLGPVDLTSDLTTQSYFADFNFLFPTAPGAPSGSYSHQRTIVTPSGELLKLTSTGVNVATVPLPSAVWSGLAVIGGIACVRRLRR